MASASPINENPQVVAMKSVIFTLRLGFDFPAAITAATASFEPSGFIGQMCRFIGTFLPDEFLNKTRLPDNKYPLQVWDETMKPKQTDRIRLSQKALRWAQRSATAKESAALDAVARSAIKRALTNTTR